MTAYEITDYEYDVVVVGAGGAGLRVSHICLAFTPLYDDTQL